MAEAPRLCLALDLDEFSDARALARRLAAYFPVVKVGLELFGATGPAAVTQLVDDGFEVFLDLKLHDIPTTVGRAAKALAKVGARYVTMHACGGEEMLRAGVEGLVAGTAAGAPPAMALGVTVLTSDAEAGPDLLLERARCAASAGCGGVVCAAPDLRVLRAELPSLTYVVPGTRPAGAAQDDQARVATPLEAAKAGASMLVIGRVVTHADDPAAAAEALRDSLAAR